MTVCFCYLATEGLSCGMLDPVPQPGIEPGPPALGAWGLSHWTAKEIPSMTLFGGSVVADAIS